MTMAGEGRRLFDFVSSRNIVKDNIGYADTPAASGATYQIGTSVENNEVSNTFQRVWSNMVTTTRIDLGSNIFKLPHAPAKGATSNTPSVFGSTVVALTYAALTTVTSLIQGSNGQLVSLRSTDGRATINHEEGLTLKGGADRALNVN
ncbi:hypothetical protein CQ018_17620 [Arthrobacter sp. MYb227]|nr:hypothetical protein CQ018_17620 [Arthrobacter sp. MYb227]